ncbi:MAG: DUF1592 domain-containing protein [Deltaproteobacteria bacterium]
MLTAPLEALLLTALAACAAGRPAAGKESLAASPVVSRASVAPAATASGYALPARARGAASFPAQPAVPLAAETQLARLSHSQYLHTLRDLFGSGASPDVVFAPDARNGFGFETSTALRVDPRLGPQYRAMAEALAEQAVKEPNFATIVPCAAGAPGCRERFLRSFGERAFRRPLRDDDLATFTKRFDVGVAFYQSGDAFRDGVRMIVEVMLQSPEFLYRMEASPAGASGASRRLDDFELASRLSYFLYDSMPDEALFAAARAGQLHTPDQVEAAARRMLGDARVLEKLVAFHEQAWQFGRFASISPDAATYPQVPKGLVWRVRRATTMFVRDVLQSGGGLVELLTAPYAYADTGLLPLYGAPLPVAAEAHPEAQSGAGRFTRVRFDPAQRKGLLMQVGYLASNAYSISTDPIHRGLFVIRNLLCREVPDPPPGATTTPPPATDQPIVTTRDEVSLVTGQSFCPTCHAEINAPGFAFEGFDAVGQLRETDHGAPVDTSGQMVLDGQLVHFQGPAALVDLLARSKEAHRCYSRRWLEFAYGRPLAQSDVRSLDAIAANSLPIADLLVAIVRSPEFLSP